jgi:DNA modification methylase
MLKIERIPISRIDPAPYNPRVDLKPTDPAYKAIVASLDQFGCVQPLVWNRRTGHLVGGHQRLKVLQARGDKHVDVSVVDLPLAQEKALNLALNKVGGRWDTNLLTELLADLVQTPELDLGATGFELPEIEELLAQNTSDEPESIAGRSKSDGPIVTKPGDLIELGRQGEHRVLCADATDPKNLAMLFGDQRASLCVTDPPYGVAYDRNARPKPRGSSKSQPKKACSNDAIVNDDLSPSKYRQWFPKVLAGIEEYLAPGRSYYIWNGHKQFGLMHDLLNERGFKVASVIAWIKESFSPGFGDFNEQVEFCVYGWKGGARHRWFGPKSASTAWEISRDRVGVGPHPTQKPLELIERSIRYSSKRDEIVYDPFLGSGTTLIGSARLGRRCYGLEIDPRYCDLIVRRYIDLAGRSAVSDELAERYLVTEEVPS